MGRRVRGLSCFLPALLLVFALSACQKKEIPFQAAGGIPAAGMGAGAGMGPGGPGMSPGFGAGSSMGLDESKWRELGLMTEPERREFMQKSQEFENDDIQFDFDSFLLSDAAKRILDKKAAFLNKYPKVTVMVEGHCDDRGTNEYNLALGERRAHSAWQYLVNSGINQTRVSTISYGEERPLATGNDESSWAKNRRDHFDLRY